MKTNLILILFLVIITSCVKEDKVILENHDHSMTIKEAMEYAYFEGQKDCLNGDIRIQQVDDSSYIWIASPWDDGDEPTFKP